MKYDLEQASLLYLGKLLSNESYYTEELEDTYINLKGAIEERNKLQQENKILKENAENNDKTVDKVNWDNKLLKQENQQLKEQLLDETKNNYKLENELEKQRKEYQETYKDVREEIKDYKNQLKQRDEVIDEAIKELKKYIDEKTCILDKTGIANDSIKELYQIFNILQKYKGDNK